MSIFISIAISIFSGLLYASLLYVKSTISIPLRSFLFGLRTLTVAVLIFLLLYPFIEYLSTYVEKPIVVFAIDDSKSMASLSEDANFLSNLNLQVENLKNESINLEIRGFEGKYSIADQFVFKHSSTDLAKLLNKIKSEYEGKPLHSVVLVSDGIVNLGQSIEYLSMPFQIHTVGVGDTTIQKDLVLSQLVFNKIVAQGNKTIIAAQIKKNGYQEVSCKISLKNEKGAIETKQILMKKNESILDVEFLFDANEIGIQALKVEISPLSDEFSVKNNSRSLFIQVINSKQKILLVADAPHPDILAIKTALSSNLNLDFEIFIDGINTLKEIPYDLIIYYQVPSISKSGLSVYDKYLSKSTPSLFIIGNKSDLSKINRLNLNFAVHANAGQFDKVTATLNNDFSLFKLSSENLAAFSTYSPIQVPFGEYNFNGLETILYQKVGQTNTNKPILSINNQNTTKIGVWIGEGFWQWKLIEQEDGGKSLLFDELFNKTIQLIATKSNLSKFRFTPLESEYEVNQKANFQVEIYNDLYEKIYGNAVMVTIQSPKKKKRSFQFQYNENNSIFELEVSEPGVYQYEATTTISGKLEKIRGEFAVFQNEIELAESTSNFEALRNLSTNNNGKFYFKDGISNISKDILKTEPKGVVSSELEIVPIITLWWILLIVMFLTSTEWFIRKYLLV